MINSIPTILNLSSEEYNNDDNFINCVQYLSTLGVDFNDTFATLNSKLTFLDDLKFNECLEKHPEERALSMVWRLHVTCWAANCCLKLPGDFVECGVERGIHAIMLASYLEFEKIPKDFYLYDSFSGIPVSYLQQNLSLNESNHPSWSQPGLYENAKCKFDKYDNIHVIKGYLPEVLEEHSPEQISFLHMDLANLESELNTLKKFIDRCTDNAMIILESFGFNYYKINQIANEPFILERGIKIFELPTNQGLIII